MSTCNQLDLQTLGSQTDDYIMLKECPRSLLGRRRARVVRPAWGSSRE